MSKYARLSVRSINTLLQIFKVTETLEKHGVPVCDQQASIVEPSHMGTK